MWGGLSAEVSSHRGSPCSVACILHGGMGYPSHTQNCLVQGSGNLLSFVGSLGLDKTGVVHLMWCDGLDWAPQTHHQPTKVQIQL